MKFFYNFFGHLNTINKHRFKVFKLCFKAGIPIRGLLHDLSKYSITEFFEGVSYYADGKLSPIKVVKKEKGYSKAWLHHKGKNKHHFEYWTDLTSTNFLPVIPYKYVVEMICDQIAAGQTYIGKDWYESNPLNHLKKRKDKKYINHRIYKFLEEFYIYMQKVGLNKALNKKTLKEYYKKYVES